MKSKTHPSPITHKPRDPEAEKIVGYFLVAFNDNPDHEYPFDVRKDGSIWPQLDPDPINRTMFSRYLADPNLHHVRFSQCTPTGDRDVEHDPWPSKRS